MERLHCEAGTKYSPFTATLYPPYHPCPRSRFVRLKVPPFLVAVSPTPFHGQVFVLSCHDYRLFKALHTLLTRDRVLDDGVSSHQRRHVSHFQLLVYLLVDFVAVRSWKV